MNKRTLLILSSIILVLLCITLYVYFKQMDTYSWRKSYDTDQKQPYDIHLFQKLCAQIDNNKSVELVNVPFSIFQKNIRKKAQGNNHLFIHLGNFKSFDVENTDSLISFARMGNTAIILEEYGGYNLHTIINKLNGFYKKPYQSDYNTQDDVTAIIDTTSYAVPTDSLAIADTTNLENTVEDSLISSINDTIQELQPALLDSVAVEHTTTNAELSSEAEEDTSYFLQSANYVKTTRDSCVTFDFSKLQLKPNGLLKHCYYDKFEARATDYSYFDDSLLNIPHKGKVYDLLEKLGTLHSKSVLIRYKIGKGSIYLGTQPILVSNYFLKEREGLNFFNALFKPFHKPSVYQNAYTHFERFDQKNKNYTPLRYVLSQEGLKWTFYIFLGLLLVFFVFFSKRRQKIIPVLPLKENSTIEYVETISRLYQSKKANRDILSILFKNFLKFIQQKYSIKFKQYDDEFAQKLSKISGIDIAYIKNIFEDTDKYIQQQRSVSDQSLNDFYFKIKHFYNKCK